MSHSIDIPPKGDTIRNLVDQREIEDPGDIYHDFILVDEVMKLAAFRTNTWKFTHDVEIDKDKECKLTVLDKEYRVRDKFFPEGRSSHDQDDDEEEEEVKPNVADVVNPPISVAAMFSSPAQPAAPTTVHHSAKELNFAAPPKFDGTIEKAEGFLFSVLTYIEANRHIYHSDRLQCGYFLSFCQEGAAKDWAFSKQVAAFNGSTFSYGLFEDLIKDFQSTFLPTSRITNAIMTIGNLRQGTMTLDAFIAKFQSLAAAAKYSDATGDPARPGRYKANDFFTLQNLFLKAINFGIGSKLMSNGDRYCMRQYYDDARRHELLYQQFTMLQGPRKKKMFRVNATSTTDDTEGAVIAKLTPETRAQLMRERKCFRCRKAGHIANACTAFANVRAIDVETPDTPVNEQAGFA